MLRFMIEADSVPRHIGHSRSSGIAEGVVAVEGVCLK